MALITTSIEEKLAEAQAAYHTLLLGQVPRVIVEVDGSRVEFTSANRANLAAYIVQLQMALQPTAIPNTPRGFIF